MTTLKVKPRFQEDMENLRNPQFFHTIPETMFTDGMLELLDTSQLAEGFTLRDKAYDIDFAAADDEIHKVDVCQNEGGLPKVFKISNADQQYFKEYFNSLPLERRVKQCKEMMFKYLNKMDTIDAAELKAYIDLIVDSITKEQLTVMEKSPMGYGEKIKKKILSLLERHHRETFDKRLETEQIVCQPYIKLPSAIHPMTSTDMIGGSLYTAEEGDMNKLEMDLVMELTTMPNVCWWHRNISRHGFCINGFINHYPNIMVMTNSGEIIFVETKGEHLKNDDSREKIALGKA